MSQFGLWGSEKRYCASVFVSPLLKRRLPSVSSLFQKNVRAHTSPSPRHLPWRAATNQAYLALDPPCTSRLKKSDAGSRFPVACLSGSVSIGFPHACLSLRVVTGSDNGPDFSGIILLICWSRCWRQTAAGIWWQSWYDKKYEVVHCKYLTSHHWSTVEFRRFSPQMGIRVLSKINEATEPLAFHRVIALLRTDRNREQKLVRPRLFALSPVTAQYRHMVLDLLRKVFIFIWALISLAQHCAFSCQFHATFPSHSSCLEVSSSALSSNLGAQGFRSWSSLFFFFFG